MDQLSCHWFLRSIYGIKRLSLSLDGKGVRLLSAICALTDDETLLSDEEALAAVLLECLAEAGGEVEIRELKQDQRILKILNQSDLSPKALIDRAVKLLAKRGQVDDLDYALRKK